MSATTTLPEVVFSLKREKFAFALVACLALCVVGIAMLWSRDPTGTFWGGAMAVLAFLFFLRGSWRLLHWNDPKLTINSNSITDTRLSPASVPWSIIRSVDGYYIPGPISRGPVQGVRLSVPEDFMATYVRTRSYRWGNTFDRATGIRGISIPATGIGLTGDELCKMCSEYWSAANKEGSLHV